MMEEGMARKVYRALMEGAGAPEWGLENFVYAQTLETGVTGYRFQGDLGFGGKVWNTDGRIFVSCYPEDLTPSRAKILREVNRTLRAFTQPRSGETQS